MSKSRKMFLSEEKFDDRKKEKNLPHTRKLPQKICTFCGADENNSILVLDGNVWYCAFQKQCNERVNGREFQ